MQIFIILAAHKCRKRQRLFFEPFAFGYSRSVDWLEPFSCLAIAERLKGCHFTPRRTALIPQQ